MLETGIVVILLQPITLYSDKIRGFAWSWGFRLPLKRKMNKQQGLNGLHDIYLGVYINFPYSLVPNLLGMYVQNKMKQ
jgi:hypothetical protein